MRDEISRWEGSSSSSYGEGGRTVSTFGMEGLAMAELKLRFLFFFCHRREREREEGKRARCRILVHSIVLDSVDFQNL